MKPNSKGPVKAWCFHMKAEGGMVFVDLDTDTLIQIQTWREVSSTKHMSWRVHVHSAHLTNKKPYPFGRMTSFTVYRIFICVDVCAYTLLNVFLCAYYLFRGPAVPMDHHSWAAAMRPIFSSKLTRRLHTCRNLCPHSDIDTVQLIVLNRSEGSNICKSRCILHPRWNNVSLLKQIDIIQSSPSLSQQLFLALHTARKNNTSRSETCQT